MRYRSFVVCALVGVGAGPVACATAANSPMDTLREDWRSPRVMVCAAQTRTFSNTMLPALAGSSNAPWMFPEAEALQGPGGLANSTCGGSDDPCLCGPRDIVLGVIAGSVLGEQDEGDYSLFEFDAERGGGANSFNSSPQLEVVVSRVGDTDGNCGTVHMVLTGQRREYAQDVRVCRDQAAQGLALGTGISSQP